MNHVTAVRRGFALSLVGLALGLVACGGAKPAAPAAPERPTGPVKVTLEWTGDADADLMINQQPGYDLGGTADVTKGPGLESITLGDSAAIVGVYNNAKDTPLMATVTVEIPGMQTITRQAEVKSGTEADDWYVLAVDPRTGKTVDLNFFD